MSCSAIANIVISAPTLCQIGDRLEVAAIARKSTHDHLVEHRLLDIALTLYGVIYGTDSWVEIEACGYSKAEWLKSFLFLPNGIPSHDTIGRLFAMLEPVHFQCCSANWIKKTKTALRKQIKMHQPYPDAKLVKIATFLGISFRIAHIWAYKTDDDARVLEKKLKRQKKGLRFYSFCTSNQIQFF